MTETKDMLVTLECLKAVHDDHASKLNDKVDKVDGKGLSANDYDDAAKAKVDAIPDDPKYTDTVYNDSELQGAVSQLNSSLQSTVGNLSELNTEEKTSLVAAINEALTKGGGEIAPADVQKIVDDYLKANPPGAGAAGKDGTTPTIGENGNWYLGDTDTGKPSRGAAGAKGADGADGKDGAKGDKGSNAYVWIRYASQQPTAASHNFDVLPDNWMGVYSGNSATAPTDWTQYQWYKIKGEKGDTGDPATLDADAATKGYVDTALNNAKTVAKTATLTVAGWTGSSAPYTQSVTVAGLTDAKRAMAYPVYGSNADSNIALKEACGMVSFASRSGGVMTFTCLEDKPAVDIPITVEVYV